MSDPALWRALWVSRARDYETYMDAQVHFARQASESADRLPRTRKRLKKIADGLDDQKSKVLQLLAPLLGSTRLVIPTRPEERDLPAVLECYENIFRDWAWGTAEMDVSRALLEPALDREVDSVAVLGAGAGRLARDLHESCPVQHTYAIDQNPLPLLVAAALIRGETVELSELPIAPHSDELVVVHHRLEFAEETREGLEWLFADAMNPPFVSGSLDAVVTCWFIDAVGTDIRIVASVINRMLRPGGRWINLGPLRLRGGFSNRYTIEEILDVIEATSFTLRSSDRQSIPYFDSPFSGSRRSETVFLFTAEKKSDAHPLPLPRPVLDWVMNPRLPIPISSPLVNLGQTSVFTASMLGLVDGSRSIVEVAAALGQTWQIDPSLILDQLRAFFAKLPA